VFDTITAGRTQAIGHPLILSRHLMYQRSCPTPNQTFIPKSLAEILAPQSDEVQKKVEWRGHPGEIKPLWAILGEDPPISWQLENDPQLTHNASMLLAQRNASSKSGDTEDHVGHRHIHPRPFGPDGPIIIFQNDVKGAPSPDLPVTNGTARMVEDVVGQLGLTININSTTGGNHAEGSNHYRAKAVDINRVNGQPVGPNNKAARRLQEAFRRHPNIREHFGPFITEKTNDGITLPLPNMKGGHSTHIHVSGQK